jgi:hypothetical protein
MFKGLSSLLFLFYTFFTLLLGLGDVILRGNKNELANVDYQGNLTQTGGPENNLF